MGEWEARRAGGADEATAAVVAHELLTTMAVIVGTCAALRDKWQHFSDADRASMLDRMESCAVDAAKHLGVVARGGTPELVP